METERASISFFIRISHIFVFTEQVWRVWGQQKNEEKMRIKINKKQYRTFSLHPIRILSFSKIYSCFVRNYFCSLFIFHFLTRIDRLGFAWFVFCFFLLKVGGLFRQSARFKFVERIQTRIFFCTIDVCKF